MKVTSKGRNALKMMIDLAEHSDGSPVRLKDIAERQEISEKYLEQTASALIKASLVKSIKGSRGGYLLKYPTRNYTVGQILKAVDGDMYPTNCETQCDICENEGLCTSHVLWEKLYAAINGVLEETTLQDMLEWQSGLGADNYVI